MQTQRQRRSISDLKQIICSALPDRQAKLLRKDFAALLVIRITGGKRKILQKNKRRECRKDAEMTTTVVQDVFGSLKILLYNYEVEKKKFSRSQQHMKMWHTFVFNPIYSNTLL